MSAKLITPAIVASQMRDAATLLRSEAQLFDESITENVAQMIANTLESFAGRVSEINALDLGRGLRS